MRGLTLRTAASLVFCLVVSALTPAQTTDDVSPDPIHHPGWNFGVQISGGSSVVQVSNPSFVTANRNISNFAASFHVGRVLTHEHGRGWSRGTFEWDFNVIPVEIFWVLGYHYAGGFEAFGPRWNFTHTHSRVLPFAGLTGGMLFSPHNFPPGPTYRTNFTIGVDVGVHLFVRRRRSVDVIGRLYHLSNAFLGQSNPGIPVGLQLTLGYVWF